MAVAETIVFLELISIGLDIADKALKLSDEFTVRIGEQDVRISEQEVKLSKLKDLIESSTISLQEAIEISTRKVIDKLEQDKFEELVSRLNNIILLLKLGNEDQILSYTLLLQESVDYAMNRLRENKKQWFLPYVVGKSIAVTIFTFFDSDTGNRRDEFSLFIRQSKMQILDEMTRRLLQSGKSIPWELVDDVLSNKEGAVARYINLIPQVTYDLTGEWELQQTDSVGGLKGTLYIFQRESSLYGGVLLTLSNGTKVQECFEGSIQESTVHLASVWFKKLGDGNYNLDTWDGTIKDNQTITGVSTDTWGTNGEFTMRKVSINSLGND